ncbi:tetratricopeptide repeat protein [Runella slithyformis]|uniref:tetratricopeptide repeat protein n=1 Tax=Runella slithyformis TaxID=106 RepID=UPI00146D8C3F|nr:tetratricopeptide repeat protein [Runella slithyformis]
MILTLLESVSAKGIDSTNTRVSVPVKVPALVVSIPKTKPVAPPGPPAAFSEKRFKQLNNAGIQQAYQLKLQTAQSFFLQAQDHSSTNDTLLYNLSLVTGLLKNYDDALEIMAQTGVGGRYLHNKGVWEAQKGELSKSMATWESAQPTDTLLFNMALANYRQNDLQGAQGRTKRVGLTKIAEFYELSANILFRLGEYKQAEKLYEKAEKFALQTGHHAVGARLLIQRGNTHLALHEYERAEELYREYLKLKDPSYRFAAHLGLGHTLYRQRKYQLAVLEYNAACRHNDYSAEAWLSLGNAYIGTNGQRQAQKAFKRALDLDSTQKSAWLGLGMVYYRLQNFGEAVGCFDQAGDILNAGNRNHADLFAARAFCRLYTAQSKPAKEDVQTAVGLSGHGLLPCLAMSEYLRMEGLFLSSLKWLEKAIKANEGANVRMLVNRGNIYLKCREYAAALDDFTEAHRMDPGNVNAGNGLAVSLLNKDEIDRAKTLYDSLLRQQKLAMLYNNRGIVQSYLSLRERHQHNYKEESRFSALSMQDFDKALQVDSTKKPYYVNIGNVYKNRNEETLAIESYQRYLSLHAINNMGVLFAKESHRDSSWHYLDIAISYDSANVIYLYNRAKLHRDHFKNVFAQRADLKQAFKLMPTNDISLKYSRDGYVTIFLFDYDFETYHFPGDPLFDVHPQPIDHFTFLPSMDFVPMAGGGDIFKKGEGGYKITRNQMRFRPASRKSRGKTSCPKM